MTTRLKWFEDSPDLGDPACVCSRCGEVIAHDIPIRVFAGEDEEMREARFHHACYGEIEHAFSGQSERAMSTTYMTPLGLPLYWQDEASGVLPTAVRAYINNRAGHGTAVRPDQLALLVAYLVYYIYAPCWQNGDSAALFPELVNLRLEAEGMVSADDVAAWIERCLEIGIDPL